MNLATDKEKDNVISKLIRDSHGVYHFDSSDQDSFVTLRQLKDEGFMELFKGYGNEVRVKFTTEGLKILTLGGFEAATQLLQLTMQQKDKERQLKLEETILQIENLKRLPEESRKTRLISWIAIAVASVSAIAAVCALFRY